MITVVTEISKYLILAVMLIYTVFNFIAIRVRDQQHSRSLCFKQLCMVFLMLTLGYLILLLRTQAYTLIAFFAIQVAFYILYSRIFTRLYPACSGVIISNTILLFGVGELMIARLDYSRSIRQLLIGFAAFILSFFIPVIVRKFKALAKFAWIYAIVGISLLVVVWRMGSTTYGAQLTLSVGGVALQPSEFVKISFVFFTASMFRRKQSFAMTVVTTAIAAVHVLVLVASTDLGSGLVYFVSYLFMIYVATHRMRYLAAGAGAGAAAAVGAYYLFDHVRIRVAMWKDPFSDYSGKGYQLSQSLFAISSGGLFGLGLAQGRPLSIPLARNDYIFSAICEELGLIFGCCLVLIYLGFILQLFGVSTRLESRFHQILGVGFAAMIGVQVFLHIGGVTKMIPATGITLPLVSYGGSSVLSTLMIIGVIQGLNISSDGLTAKQRARQREEELDSGMI